MSVFDLTNKTSHLNANAFLDPNGGVAIQRFESLKYPFFDKLTDKQLGFFWRPEEVELHKDGMDFKTLSYHEKHIFTSNLKRQILLDSVQGRSPNLAFLPIVSLPELEAWITTWAFSETIHSRSYTHIIRNVYPNPSFIFDEMTEIQEIVDCAKDISANYDDLISKAVFYNLLGEGAHTVNGKTIEVSSYEVKKALWLALNSVNILEGIRFYVSFACSWAFAELKKMEGNAKIIKLICRDENLHLGGTQMLLRILPKDDRDYATIAEETRAECVELFRQAAEQEKSWAKYLFKDGSIIGLNEPLLCQYVEFITNKRMVTIGLPLIFKNQEDPLPWTKKWISGSNVQVAPQEVQLSSYIVGGTKQDITNESFSGFKL
jgi:ribonucleoside-diphosphate reductase beta chain